MAEQLQNTRPQRNVTAPDDGVIIDSMAFFVFIKKAMYRQKNKLRCAVAKDESCERGFDESVSFVMQCSVCEEEVQYQNENS